MAQAIQVYLGVPKTSVLPVYTVPAGRRTKITDLIFYNTDTEDASVTLSINTTDAMKHVIKGGQTLVLTSSIVLNENDKLSLQQDKQNAINVTISGELE
ncbi:hypothetical protein [Bacillus cereus]|uniref:hypothetical protein n=1 Tax=Bacillus cereus TaxID=1396 RepID=UPI00381BAC11